MSAALVLLGSAFPAAADDTGPLTAEYSLRSWSGGDGITLGSIRSLAQTPDGFLWLASTAGLVRFDGFRFASTDLFDGDVDLPQTQARAVYVGRDGSLWVGYGEGSGVFRIHNGAVREVHLRDQFPGLVNSIIEDRAGTVWVGHDNGLMRRRGGDWTTVALPAGSDKAVYDVYEDGAGTIWVSTDEGLYRRRSDDVFEIISENPGLAREITEDNSGGIWTTDQNMAFRRSGEKPPATHFEGRGMSVLHDRRGDLWVATIGQGLWRVRQAGTRRPVVEKVTVRDGLTSDEVGGLFEDRDGNIWAGSIQGLNRLTPHKVRSITGLGLVNAVAIEPNGTVLAGTTTGLVALDENSARATRTRQVVATGAFRTLHRARNGTVWGSSNEGIFQVVDGYFAMVPTPGVALTQVTSIASGPNNTLWLSDSTVGLVRLTERRHLERFPQVLDETGRPPQLLFVDRDARLWMAFPSGRLQVRSRDGRFQWYGEADGLPHRQLFMITQDRAGDIWVGGNAGISRLQRGRFQTLSFAEGSVERAVVAFAEDHADDVWIAVAFVGIVHAAAADVKAAFENPANGLHYRLYTPSDGTAGWPDNSIGSGNGIITTDDAALWFVTGRGLTVLDPRNMRRASNSRSEAPRIMGVYANERRYTASLGTALPPETTRIRIDYTQVNLASSDRARFRYRLDGFDSDWVESTRRQAVYTNLPPGDYRFRVQAAPNRGSFGDDEAQWRFTVEPMFYQTRGFYLLAAALVMLACGSVWRLRVGRLRREVAAVFAERLRLSREIHDTLLQSLVGVSLQLDALAHEMTESTGQPAARAVSMRKQLEDYIREARESIWDLRSSKLSHQGLIGALGETGERLTTGKVRFTMRVVGTPRPCPADLERHVLRIAHEAITNTVRHSGARRVDLELAYQRSQLHLRVVDDGCGIAAEAPAPGHYGLLGMRERAADAGGQLSIESRPGSGVAVFAEFPLAASA
jgi:signal transduction histidine kinase/ligand-binding sensor domain-containing protein